MIRAALLSIAVAATLSGGCDPVKPEVFLGALTAPPPTLTATVENPYEGVAAIDMSVGVGLGIGCSEYCPDRDYSVPDCIGTTYAIDPPSLAQLHPVDLPGRNGTALLIADEVGNGRLTVRTQCAEKEYRLRISE